MEHLQKHIEALIFCAPTPLKIKEMSACLSEMFETEIPETDIQQAVDGLIEKYQANNFSFEIVKVGGGFQFLTKPAYQASISLLLKQTSKKRLSKSALETLSIVAYKQPITKSEVEQIRGVSCDYAVRKLLDKGLIEILGKSDKIGRPVIYGTTDKFLTYFGINTINELPTPKDFSEEEAITDIENINPNPQS